MFYYIERTLDYGILHENGDNNIMSGFTTADWAQDHKT
jgi:hypothetical protein